VKDSTLFGDIYLKIYFMKLTNLAKESVPKKKKRLKIMITETQLKQLVDVTLLHEGKNLIKKTQLFKILNNEKN
jgi:hypothetical protein